MAPSPIPRAEDFVTFNVHNPFIDKPSGTCIYYLVKEGRTCKKSMSEAEKARCLRKKIEQSPNVLIDDLQEYAKASCCKQFHRSKIEDCGILPAVARKWHTEIINTRENEVVSQNSFAERKVDERSSDSTPSVTHTTRITDQSTRYNLRSRTNTQQSLLLTASEASDGSSASHFRPHIQEPEQNLTSKLLKFLTPRDAKSGTLYLYDRVSSPGFVKIGLTTASIQSRFGSIARQCGYKPQLLYSFDDVPHVYRVELLVHFELLQSWRVEKRCAGCNRQHKEWFETDVERAIQIAQQWVTWMKEATPYDRDGILTTTWRDRLRQLQAEARPVTAESLLEMYSTSRSLPAPSQDSPNNIPALRSMATKDVIDFALMSGVVRTLFAVTEQLEIQRALDLSRESLQHTTNIGQQPLAGPSIGGQLFQRDTNMSIVSQA